MRIRTDAGVLPHLGLLLTLFLRLSEGPHQCNQRAHLRSSPTVYDVLLVCKLQDGQLMYRDFAMMFKSRGLMTPRRNWDPTLSASLEEHNDGKDGVVNALSATCTCCREALGPRIR